MSDLSRDEGAWVGADIAVEENVRQYLEWLDTQSGTTEFLDDAERVMAERGVVQRVR